MLGRAESQYTFNYYCSWPTDVFPCTTIQLQYYTDHGNIGITKLNVWLIIFKNEWRTPVHFIFLLIRFWFSLPYNSKVCQVTNNLWGNVCYSLKYVWLCVKMLSIIRWLCNQPYIHMYMAVFLINYSLRQRLHMPSTMAYVINCLITDFYCCSLSIEWF